MGDIELNPVYEPLPLRREPPEGMAEEFDYGNTDKHRKTSGNSNKKDVSSKKRSLKSNSSKESTGSKAWSNWRRFLNKSHNQERNGSSKHWNHGPNLTSFRPALVYVPKEFDIRETNYRNSPNADLHYSQYKSLDRDYFRGRHMSSNSFVKHDDIYSYFNPNNRIRLLRHDSYDTRHHRSRSNIVPSYVFRGKYISPVTHASMIQHPVSRPPSTRQLPLRTIEIHRVVAKDGDVSYASHVTVPIVRSHSAPPISRIRVSNSYIPEKINKLNRNMKVYKPIARHSKLETLQENDRHKIADNGKPRAKYSHVTLSIPPFRVENQLIRETETLTISCNLFEDASDMQVNEFAEV